MCFGWFVCLTAFGSQSTSRSTENFIFAPHNIIYYYLQAVENRASIEIFQVLGVEVSSDGSTESNVRSFVTIYYQLHERFDN
jgi:hypothetical protein